MYPQRVGRQKFVDIDIHFNDGPRGGVNRRRGRPRGQRTWNGANNENNETSQNRYALSHICMRRPIKNPIFSIINLIHTRVCVCYFAIPNLVFQFFFCFVFISISILIRYCVKMTSQILSNSNHQSINQLRLILNYIR